MFFFFLNKKLNAFQIVSQLTSIAGPFFDGSGVEILRYALSAKIYEKALAVP